MRCRNRLWKPQPGENPKRRSFVKVIDNSPHIPTERETKEYYEWRADIIVRDRHSCVLCSKRDFIHVHHIVRWIDNESLRYDIKNGVCLCIPCHMLNHGPQNKPFPAKITNQLLEYIKQSYPAR